MGSSQKSPAIPPASTVRSPPPDAEQRTGHRSTNLTGAVTGSPAENRSSPPKEKKTTAIVSRDSTVRGEAVTGSSFSSPSSSVDSFTAGAKETKPPLLVPHPRAPSLMKADAVTGSPADYRTSPPKERETTALVPRVASIRTEAMTGSPVRSPARTAGKVNGAPKEVKPLVIPYPRTSSLKAEAMMGSPVRSPEEVVNDSPVRALLRDAVEQQTKRSASLHQSENSCSSVSSFWSAQHDAENPTASPHYKDKECSLSPMSGALTVCSILSSPLASMATEGPFSPEKTIPPPIGLTNPMVTGDMTSTTTVERQTGGWRGSPRSESGTIRQPAISKAAIGLRVCAWALCLISFSVMAADKTSGWDGDSFDRYREFRYCLSMNALVFTYSSFQLYVHVHYKITHKWIMGNQFSCYFNFSMDQILAYLLMSASSSAASRNSEWVSNFGSDKFTKGISGSVAMSFLAFFALAFSSVISTYKFFSWIS